MECDQCSGGTAIMADVISMAAHTVTGLTLFVRARSVHTVSVLMLDQRGTHKPTWRMVRSSRGRPSWSPRHDDEVFLAKHNWLIKVGRNLFEVVLSTELASTGFQEKKLSNSVPIVQTSTRGGSIAARLSCPAACRAALLIKEMHCTIR